MLTTLILGQHNKKASLIGGLNALKAKSGVYLNTLLGGAMCGEEKCDDLVKFEKYRHKTWFGIELHEDPVLKIGEFDYIFFERLSSYMDEYIDGISQSLESYMPKDEMYSTMSALDTSSWPDDVTKVLEVDSEETTQLDQSRLNQTNLNQPIRNLTNSDQPRGNQTNLIQQRTNLTNSEQPSTNQTNLGNEWIGPIKKWPALYNMQDDYGDTAFMADFSSLITCLATSEFW